MSEKKNIDKLIGENIRRERIKAGYTQDQFSEIIGIGTKSLSAVERGVVGISIVTLIKILKTLSVSANSILFEGTEKRDVSSITERLERLSEKELEIANDVLMKVIEAFSVNGKE